MGRHSAVDAVFGLKSIDDSSSSERPAHTCTLELPSDHLENVSTLCRHTRPATASICEFHARRTPKSRTVPLQTDNATLLGLVTDVQHDTRLSDRRRTVQHSQCNTRVTRLHERHESQVQGLLQVLRASRPDIGFRACLKAGPDL